MAMTARMRRLAADWEQIQKDFDGNPYITVTPVGELPPEKYHVTYFVKGIYLLPDGSMASLARHEVDITLHADYPRYKPICSITTPIWHPNFRDGQICIGDIWGAGESLSDIIINIGDMIQYKSWNAYSPLSAEAAQWAIENKYLFPIGDAELRTADRVTTHEEVTFSHGDGPESSGAYTDYVPEPTVKAANCNDFSITAEELAGVEFTPSAQYMHTAAQNLVKGKRVDFRTVLTKGVLWALIGALIGFAVSELTMGLTGESGVAKMMGQEYLSEYYEYTDDADKAFDLAVREFISYCRQNGLDSDSSAVFTSWYNYHASDEALGHLDDYSDYDDAASFALYMSYKYDFDSDLDALDIVMERVTRISVALWSGIVALFIGLFLGLGEGVYYGSKSKAFKYAAIGAGVALAMGFLSGYLAQLMYSALLSDSSSDVASALLRGLAWAIMGLGVGLAVGLIKPQGKRILFCSIGGTVGGFIGGFAFNYICDVIYIDVVSRGVGLVLTGLLIGVGVGLLEQFAKRAWLKVIRGEFEGKEYLVFAGTTSIGNNGKNTIVLFKDQLVAPHHCDIVLEGGRYVLVDAGSGAGTVVNGNNEARHVLRQGDAIAVGNSVLVFNTK